MYSTAMTGRSLGAPSAAARISTVRRPNLAPAGRRALHVTASADEKATKEYSLLSLLGFESMPSNVSQDPSNEKYSYGKEGSRKYRRTVYDFDAWVNHRRTKRYWRNISTIPNSRIASSLLAPMLWVSACGVAAGLYDTAVTMELINAPHLNVPMVPLNFTSFALSLLLVFRTNSSYGRWWEARKIWGSILNRSRDLVRQGQTFFPAEAAPARGMLARWMVAHNYALMSHLRADDDIREVMEPLDVLTPAELDALEASPHRPLYAMQVISELIDVTPMTNFQRMQLHQNVTFFHDTMGMCERILRTPIPVSYTRHTSRFLLIWLTCLPFALWHTTEWWTIPISVVTSFFLLGIEEIGVQIEEPFGILPLEVISGRARQDIEDMQVYGMEVKALVEAAVLGDPIYVPTNPLYGSAPSGLERSRLEQMMQATDLTSDDADDGALDMGSVLPRLPPYHTYDLQAQRLSLEEDMKLGDDLAVEGDVPPVTGETTEAAIESALASVEEAKMAIAAVKNDPSWWKAFSSKDN